MGDFSAIMLDIKDILGQMLENGSKCREMGRNVKDGRVLKLSIP